MTYTSFPKVDIKTHRSIARWNKRISVLVFVAGTLYVPTAESPSFAAIATVAIAGMIYSAALSMRLQALEWQIQEVDGE